MSENSLAALAFLNDQNRSDLKVLQQKLLKLPREHVDVVLDAAVDIAHDVNRTLANDTIVARLSRELTPDVIAAYRLILQDYRQRGVKVVTFWEGSYPESLRRIDAPPAVLYILGSFWPPTTSVAVVGTREISNQGQRLGRLLVEELAKTGFGVISGLALGSDTIAHTACLQSGGRTWAVLAGNVDQISPASNRHLAESMQVRGGIVAEITRNTSSHKGRFIERNRITSGLASAVLVLESRTHGGTPHQARFAISQGKPTFILDQTPFEDPEAEKGFKALTKLGAVPIRTASEFLNHWRIRV